MHRFGLVTHGGGGLEEGVGLGEVTVALWFWDELPPPVFT